MWQTLRGEEILSILPQRTVKKVAKLISEYANSKNRG
jgi:hypothetical protein